MSDYIATVHDDPVLYTLRTVGMLANAAIAAHGKAVIGVSGGSHPANVAAALRTCSAEDIEVLQADKWVIVLVDERCVPLDHEDSTYRAWMDEVFKPGLLSTPHSAIYPIDPDLGSACAMARDYAATVSTLCPSEAGGIPVLDVVWCGIGPDGHTASLFPGHDLVTSAGVHVLTREASGGSTGASEEVLVVQHIEDSPKPPPTRVTLSLATLNAARSAVFLVQGASKADAVAAAANSILAVKRGEPMPADTLPCARVWPGRLGTPSNQRAAVLDAQDAPRLRWVLDAPAASAAPAGWLSVL